MKPPPSRIRRYLPHELTTRITAVKSYRSTKDISFVCRRYHISKSSLMRWNRRYDGTKDSLLDRSHRPLTPHPNSHTPLELKWIKDYCRRNPGISIMELYGKLKREKGYIRSPGSLARVLQSLGLRTKPESSKKKVSITSRMIRRKISGRNGSWTLSMFQLPAMLASTAESFINIL